MPSERIEHDVLGQKAVPAEAYYGIQTQRGIVELVREKGLLTEEEIEAVLDPAQMTGLRRK